MVLCSATTSAKRASTASSLVMSHLCVETLMLGKVLVMLSALARMPASFRSTNASVAPWYAAR